MKILVLGENSFLAKEMKDNFQDDSRFEYVSRRQINLEDERSVTDFFKNKYYDIIINTCVVGGKRGVEDNASVFNRNVEMFNNLLLSAHRYDYLFNFCSGAALDRRHNLLNAKEEDIFDRSPIDYYGLSKNLIARCISRPQHSHLYNFRIFGCFGRHEEPTRFIKNSLSRIASGQPISISKNKYMDYISATDLCRVLEYYINNIQSMNLPRDINLVYKEKKTLVDIANQILLFKGMDNGVIIDSIGMDLAYTGDGTKLEMLPIKLQGFNKSLEGMLLNV